MLLVTKNGRFGPLLVTVQIQAAEEPGQSFL